MNEGKPSIEDLERILSSEAPLSVEIKPDGSIHAYRDGEAREQGPVQVFTLKQAMGDSY